MTAIGRRELGAGLAAIAALRYTHAFALGRTPTGGRLSFSVPWSLASIDPHDAFDPVAALFGGALFDTLVAADARVGFRPALADTLPVREAGATLVRLRRGLKTASGTSMDARDLLASLRRSKARGGAPLLEPLGDPTPHPTDPFAIFFTKAPVVAVVRALASPLTALVPRAFDPRSPDGTGPFAASLRAGELLLTRNPLAAMGASFLEGVSVRAAPDLRGSLRDFEAGRDDLGWLGSGVFASRAGSKPFDLGQVGWIVLAGGRDLKPGELQALVDGVSRDKLAHLGLGAIPAGREGTAWQGAPTELWVDRDAPHLVETALALVDALSHAGHEITMQRALRGDVLSRRRRGEAPLSLHVVRPVGAGPLGALLGLALLDDPVRAREFSRSPPRLPDGSGPRDLTRELRVAVVGELRVTGGVMPPVVLAPAAGGGLDLGATFRRRG